MWNKIQRIYVGTTKVRPSGWTPWANTIAYFPFKDDILDHSWNGRTLKAPSITKSWIGYRAVWWVAPTNTSSSIKTWSLWFYVVSGSSPFMGIWWMGNAGCGYYYKHNERRLNQHLFCWTSSSFGASTVSLSIWTWAWHNLVFVYDTTWPKLYGYLDGTQYLIYNSTPYSFDNSAFIIWSQRNSSSDNFSGNFTCDLSEFILETKARTAQEVLDYYNKTKWNYGL